MADEKSAEPVPAPGSAMALRNWRVRTRLISLIAIPTLVAVMLGGLRVTTSVSSAQQYQHISNVSTLVAQLGELSREMALERDLSAQFVASNRASAEKDQLEAQQDIVNASVTRTGAAATAAEDSLSDLGRKKLATVRTRLTQLTSLRATVTGSQLPPLPTMEKYSEAIAEMVQLYDEVTQGSTDEQLISTTAALQAMARYEEETSKLRGLLMIALVRGSFEEPEYKAFLDARSRRESARTAFRTAATVAQRQFFDNTVASVKVGRGEFYMNRAVFLTNTGLSLRRLDTSTSDDVSRWFESISDTVDSAHTVQKALSEQVTTISTDVQSNDQYVAVLNIALVITLIILVLAITAVMARSLVRPLRRLRGDALKVAGQTLPELVRQLRTSEVSSDDIQVPPIAVSSKDEIGEVARAFDEVHREAVRLAGEESKLRTNVNAMFVNLSRRSQTLVERQITLIDGLEQGEQDESRLANLFKLDHLATRMRRNSENLLVLAGQDPPRRWSQPVKLIDVTRATLSEVENYERVVLQVPDGVSVAGQAVNDVIHLLAELVENALSFSPRETRVTVSGSRIDGGGVMLSITDSGIGMTVEELGQANDRLVDAPIVDVSVSRRMGLFVVARLAHRHGIRVQLRPHGSGGLTAMVLMPETLVGAQAPAPAYAGVPSGAREEAYPAPQWQGGGGYQMGPGHPSYSSIPSGGSADGWPSTPPRPDTGRPVEPRSDYSTYDSTDIWAPSRNPSIPSIPSSPSGPSSWPSDSGLPKWPTGDQPQSWSRGDRAGGPARQRYDFPETGSVATGPIPTVKPATSGDEYLPIFAAVESAWFEHGSESSASWGSSNADAGWSAAETVVQPVRDGATSAGLPKRVPKANLVPGSAQTAAAPQNVAPMPAPSPEQVRNRLSSFQQGFRAARNDISSGKTSAADPTNSGGGT
ncbi:nitrate- and nitrite sensing domain-containing protein [Nonomuraea sp. NPDC049269]|uniref:sensor histidine kinase n=1 Tax=Nonomuraea sp. NPDC049269 TaxID=3364349 RepID=UPI00371A7BBD